MKKREAIMECLAASEVHADYTWYAVEFKRNDGPTGEWLDYSVVDSLTLDHLDGYNQIYSAYRGKPNN